MKSASLLALTIALLAMNSNLVCASEPKAETGLQSLTLDRAINVKMEYLLYLPEDYDQKESCPLLIFLHGAGERGTDLQRVKTHGPPKLIEQGQQFPFIVVSPQCPKGQWWQTVEVNALLDEIVEKYKVDEERVYLTGLSMGGFGTWGMAAYAPHRLAAIAPICGGSETYWAKEFAHLPVWVFHGAKDGVVPLQRSEEMVEALKKHGATVKFTVYPEANHDSWTETYNNPQLYDWLLEHKRVTQE